MTNLARWRGILKCPSAWRGHHYFVTVSRLKLRRELAATRPEGACHATHRSRSGDPA